MGYYTTMGPTGHHTSGCCTTPTFWTLQLIQNLAVKGQRDKSPVGWTCMGYYEYTNQPLEGPNKKCLSCQFTEYKPGLPKINVTSYKFICKEIPYKRQMNFSIDSSNKQSC